MGIFLNRLGVSSGKEYRPDAVVTTESFMYEDYVDDYTYAYADLMETMCEADPTIMGSVVTEAAGGFAVALKAFMSTMLGKIIAIIGVVLAAIIAFIAAKKGGSSGGSGKGGSDNKSGGSGKSDGKSSGSGNSGSGTSNDKPKKDDDYVIVKYPDGKTKKVPRSEINTSNKEDKKRKKEEAARKKEADCKKAEDMCKSIAQKAAGKSIEILKSIQNEKIEVNGIVGKILSGKGSDVIAWLNRLPDLFTQIHTNISGIDGLVKVDILEIVEGCSKTIYRIRHLEDELWSDDLTQDQLKKYLDTISNTKDKFISKYNDLFEETNKLKDAGSRLKGDVNVEPISIRLTDITSGTDIVADGDKIKEQCNKLRPSIKKLEDSLEKIKLSSTSMVSAIARIETDYDYAIDSSRDNKYTRATNSEDENVRKYVNQINAIRTTYQECCGRVRPLLQSAVIATADSLSVVKRIVDAGRFIYVTNKDSYVRNVFRARFRTDTEYAKAVVVGTNATDVKFIRDTLDYSTINEIFNAAYRTTIFSDRTIAGLASAIGDAQIVISATDLRHFE